MQARWRFRIASWLLLPIVTLIGLDIQGFNPNLVDFLSVSAHAQTLGGDDIPPMARKAKGFDLSLLKPVDGVTLRQIGQASYYFGFVPKATKEEVLAKLGVDEAHYEAAEKVFTQRMIEDKTFTITALFGAYADEVAQGQYARYARDVARSVLAGSAPLREPEPMTEDEFRLIQSYYARKAGTAGTKTTDLDRVLEPYHMTYNDFQILSGWFGRRFALQGEAETGGEPPGATDPVANETPPAKPVPELGGLWRINWTLLKYGDHAMEFDRQSRDVCIKIGMTAETLPLMPKRGKSKCALHNIDFYPTGIMIGAQCDQGDFGSSWSLHLQPENQSKVDLAQNYTGEMQFSMENEVLQDLAPHASTPVTAKRIGDCP